MRKCLATRLVVVGDLFKTLVDRRLGLMVEQDGRIVDIVEQRVHPPVEQRQPVLQPAGPASLAHRVIERVAARLRAEMGDVALAEAFYGFGGDRRLVHGHEIERAQLRGGALRFGIEGADGFEHVAEKIEPHRAGQAGRIEIDNAAAQRVFAGVAHGGGA